MPDQGRIRREITREAASDRQPGLRPGRCRRSAHRALILLACFCGLRWGELAGLQHADINCDHRTVRIARQLCEVAGRPPFLAPPKSDAGKRTVSMPSMIVADVSVHLDAFTMSEAEALVFTSPHGKPLRHPNFRRGVWYPALATTGLDVHFHDLRHTGNQLTADAGANLRELMERIGHSSSRAALIYLHSTGDRQRQLAETVAMRCNPNSATRARQERTVWHVCGTTARAPMAKHRDWLVFDVSDQGFGGAPRPRLERGTYCLGGTFEN
jgi:integrase